MTILDHKKKSIERIANVFLDTQAFDALSKKNDDISLDDIRLSFRDSVSEVAIENRYYFSQPHVFWGQVSKRVYSYILSALITEWLEYLKGAYSIALNQLINENIQHDIDLSRATKPYDTDVLITYYDKSKYRPKIRRAKKFINFDLADRIKNEHLNNIRKAVILRNAIQHGDGCYSEKNISDLGESLIYTNMVDVEMRAVKTKEILIHPDYIRSIAVRMMAMIRFSRFSVDD